MNRIMTISKLVFIILCFLYLSGCTIPEQEMYTVSFDTDGGSIVDDVQTDGKSIIQMPANPTKEGHTFIGWYWDDTHENLFTQNAFIITPINEDITVYAAWVIDFFTITFDSDGGPHVSSITRLYNTEIEKPNDPIRPGYTFIGWYSDEAKTIPYVFSKMPGQNITVYAKWQINQATISFDVDGGSIVPAITQDYLSAVTAPTPPTKTGYTFLGWYANTSKTIAYQFTTMPAIDITLYAKWELNKYTITYDVAGGEEIPPKIFNYGQEVLRVVPVRAGFTFAGWFLDEARTFRFNYGPMPAEDFILYAKWERKQYQLKYYILTEDYQGGRFTPLFDEEIVQISLGYDYSAALTSTGRLFTWGINSYGKLGDETYQKSDLPKDITQFFSLLDGEKISQITLGYNHSAALTTNGRIFTWGYNKFNNLGDGSTIDKNTPKDITPYFLLNEGEKVIQVSLGENHSGALTSSGRVFMWGFNSSGQLGDRTNNYKVFPTDITSFFNLNAGEEIIQIALGAYHSSALTSAGRLYMWGANNEYQLGDNTGISKHAPIDITKHFALDSGDKIIKVSLGDNHSAAITASGRIFTWGTNGSGQLGDGTREMKRIPNEITNMFALDENEKITHISINYAISSVLTSNGQVYTWGFNNYGQLGINDPIGSAAPQNITERMPLLDNEVITNISLGRLHSAVLTSNGRMFAWGSNNYGSLGNDSNTSTSYPVQVRLFRYIEDYRIKLDYDTEIPEYLPELEGYIFSGWYRNLMFSYPNDNQKMPDNDVKLYGYWIKDDSK